MKKKLANILLNKNKGEEQLKQLVELILQVKQF